MPTYSLLDPFEFPYYFYRIRGELIKVLYFLLFFVLYWLRYKYFLPDFGPSSGENLLQKWCNFCFSKLLLCNQHLIELIFKPVLTYLNVFSYWHYLQNYI